MQKQDSTEDLLQIIQEARQHHAQQERQQHETEEALAAVSKAAKKDDGDVKMASKAEATESSQFSPPDAMAPALRTSTTSEDPRRHASVGLSPTPLLESNTTAATVRGSNNDPRVSSTSVLSQIDTSNMTPEEAQEARRAAAVAAAAEAMEEARMQRSATQVAAHYLGEGPSGRIGGDGTEHEDSTTAANDESLAFAMSMAGHLPVANATLVVEDMTDLTDHEDQTPIYARDGGLSGEIKERRLPSKQVSIPPSGSDGMDEDLKELIDEGGKSSKCRKFYKNHACMIRFVIVLVTLVVISVSVPLAIRAQNNNSNTESTPGNTPTETRIPCLQTYDELVMAVDDYLAGGSSRDEVLLKYGDEMDRWCVSHITKFDYLFSGLRNPNATRFNEPLWSWDVSKALSAKGMFQNATLFDQPLGSWDLGNVQDMTQMFYGASKFRQDLCPWTEHLKATSGDDGTPTATTTDMFRETRCEIKLDPVLGTEQYAGAFICAICNPGRRLRH